MSGVIGCGSSTFVTPKPRTVALPVLDDAERDARHAVLGHLLRDQRRQLLELRICLDRGAPRTGDAGDQECRDHERQDGALHGGIIAPERLINSEAVKDAHSLLTEGR